MYVFFLSIYDVAATDVPTNGGDSNNDHSGTVVSTILSSLGQWHLVGLTSTCCRLLSVCADQA